jgi:cytochrome c
MKALPGTRMAFAGIADAADRKALILYLKAQSE